jgi:hypothetical protein
MPRHGGGGPGRTIAVGPLAQLVEQGTFNPKVAGSIPARPMPGILLVEPSLPESGARTVALCEPRAHV